MPWMCKRSKRWQVVLRRGSGMTARFAHLLALGDKVVPPFGGMTCAR